MPRTLKLLVATVALLATFGCNSRTDKANSGGVILGLEALTWPTQVSVTEAVEINGGVATVPTLLLSVTPTNPFGSTSNLMDVEILNYEVTFQRVDSGTRTPTGLVRSFPATIDVGTSSGYSEVIFAQQGQLEEVPLSELNLYNGGFDRETGEDTIVLDVSMRFFGRTVAGNRVESNTITFTVNFTR